MAITEAKPDNTIQRTHYAVYYKWAWTDPWIYAPYFEPLSANRAVAPTISAATIKFRYGAGEWEDSEIMKGGHLTSSFCYYYIQIRIQRGKEEKTLWTGLIPAETFQLLGQSGTNKSAEQIIQAQGLEILLRNRLDGSWIKPVGGSEENKQWINHIMTFNQRHEYGGNIIGNRSSGLEPEKLTYIFGADGEQWSNYEIAEYLLAHYEYENGPQFYLTGDETIINALNKIIGVYDLSKGTVLDALNTLINRGRGFGWYLDVNDEYIDIVPYSLLDEDLILGDIVMPANPKKVAIDLWSEQKHIDVEVSANVSNVYDRIVVQGARIKSCCSLSFATSSLEKGWSTAEETAFKNATGNDAEINDKFRAEDRFQRVFTTLRVPYNWDWIINSNKVNPWLDSAGELHTDTSATYWNADKRIDNLLPFKEGIDYSGSSPVDKNPANSEPEFRPMFVLVKDSEGKYQYADRLNPCNANIRALSREFGVSMRFRPQYIAAKNHWSGAKPGEYDDYVSEIGIDYTDSIATVFIETDQALHIVHSFNFYENQRTLTIDIPDAELWYITPGTVIGVDENGDLVTYGCSTNLLRDDRDRLRAALAAAMAWYGKERNKITVTIKEIDPGIPLGTLIENSDIADVGAIGTPVTEIHWNFQKGAATTTIITDFGELDIAGIYRR